MIKWARNRYPKLSRTELAGTVCELIGWNTLAGSAKIQQCNAFFEVLEAEGIIQFPVKKEVKPKKEKNKIVEEFDTTRLEGSVKDYEPIRIEIVRPGNDLKRWRSYVQQYHMLGYKIVFGSRLHYFVKSGDTELGCIQFSASAWSLEDRDKWIGWTVEDRKIRLHLIVNNSRFLIFPWVHIKNLASKALSIAINQIQEDWLKEYCYSPVMLETFVDTSFFSGTCYKASNWVYLGETKGTGRTKSKENIVSRKAIFVYPLQKDFKACLKGEKPYKVVEPE
jgi:hypothetical protein